MMKVTLVIGLPCSGKTTLAKEMAEECGGLVIDDPQNLSWLDREDVRSSEFLIITDPYLCYTDTRDNAIRILHEYLPLEYGKDMDFIYFENDPISCLRNAEQRKGKPVRNLIHMISPYYEIPRDQPSRPVYQGVAHV